MSDSELFERIKTRRASGDKIFEGIPELVWRGRGGMSQDLGVGNYPIGELGCEKVLWFCRCFACFPTDLRALRPLFCLIPDNCPKISLIPDVLMAIPPHLSTGEIGPVREFSQTVSPL